MMRAATTTHERSRVVLVMTAATMIFAVIATSVLAGASDGASGTDTPATRDTASDNASDTAADSSPGSPASPATQPGAEGLVRVGMLVYADGKTGVCFADGFLATVGRETQVNLSRRMEAVDLSSDDLYRYPFVVMSGTGAFRLSPREVEQLRSYLSRGGFVLASAGCSDRAWADSFRQVIRDLWGPSRLQPIDAQHSVLHTLFELDRLTARKPTTPAGAVLFGLEIGDRLAAVFSPLGLNDTANAGRGCCCCGGNELRQARLINANILAYTLTH
jgi:hypothetical protein